MVEEKPKPPPPPPKPVEQKPKLEPKPAEKPTPVDPTVKAREKAEKSMRQYKDAFADLRQTLAIEPASQTKNLTGAVGQDSKAERSLIAAKAGASYVSPFLGRLDDMSQDGLELIEQMRTIFDNYGIEAQILAASLRHPMHVVECAMMGADIATIPFDVMKKLFKHPLTDKGIATFKADYAKIPTLTNPPPAPVEKKAKKAKK